MAQEHIGDPYRQETREHLGQISDALLRLEKQGPQPQLLDDIWRALHSLKGGASVAGLMDVAQVAHAMEDVLAAIQEAHLLPTSEPIDALLQAVDFLDAYLLAAPEDGAAEMDPQSVIARLEKLAGSGRDALTRMLPGLSPEAAEVLTERQRQRLVEAVQAGDALYEVSAYLKGDTFTQDIEELGRALAEEGEVVAKNGTPEDAKEGYDLHFTMLLVSSKPQKTIEKALTGAKAVVRSLREVLHQPRADEAAAVPEPQPKPVAKQTRRPEPPAEDLFDDPAMLELRQVFLEEALERLNDLSRHILRLEESPEDREVVNELFRIYHSLKGTGGTYGFPVVSAVAHELETLIDSSRKSGRPFSSAAIDLMLESVDVLGKIFQQAKEGTLDQGREIPLIGRVQAFMDTSRAPERKPSAPQPAAPTIRAVGDETIRVGLQKLDHLVQIAGEMILGRTQVEDLSAGFDGLQRTTRTFQRGFHSMRDALLTGAGPKPSSDGPKLRELLDRRAEDSDRLVSQVDDITDQVHRWAMRSGLLVDELQEEVLNVRMLPVGNLFRPFVRTVRDLSKSSGKEVSLVISGEETELDKRAMEEISDPIMHIIRNCVDHGIESPEVRRRAGKPRVGTIRLSACQEGNRAVIEVEDDGAGIDPAKVKRAAIERGIIEEGQAAALRDEEAVRLIFEPGFSTKEAVSTVSGRGVGMDVVKTNVAKLTGTVDVQSVVGKGTKTVIRLPLTLAVVQGLVVRCGPQIFCIPTTSVDDVFRISKEEMAQMTTVGGQRSIQRAGHVLPLVGLADLLGIQDPGQREEPRFAVVIHSAENKRIGVLVHELVREEGIIVKSLGTFLGAVENVAGATILSDGDIALVLGASALVRTAETKGAVAPICGAEVPAVQARASQTVMVVDDSFIARELLASVVESCGYKVISVSNGADALRRLRSQPSDLVIADVDMPALNGLELTSRIKGENTLKHVPVIVISAQEDDEAKRKGMEAGADAFIAKGAFEQRDLISTIESFLSVDGSTAAK